MKTSSEESWGCHTENTPQRQEENMGHVTPCDAPAQAASFPGLDFEGRVLLGGWEAAR